MIDITQQNDDELYLRVMNSEGLYNTWMDCKNPENMLAICVQLYRANAIQMNNLIKDLYEELEE